MAASPAHERRPSNNSHLESVPGRDQRPSSAGHHESRPRRHSLSVPPVPAPVPLPISAPAGSTRNGVRERRHSTTSAGSLFVVKGTGAKKAHLNELGPLPWDSMATWPPRGHSEKDLAAAIQEEIAAAAASTASHGRGICRNKLCYCHKLPEQTYRSSSQSGSSLTETKPWIRHIAEYVMGELDPDSDLISGALWKLLETSSVVYVFFLLTVLSIGAGIMYAIEGGGSVRMTIDDGFYMAVSAITETGLNSVDMTKLHGGTEFILWLLILMGSPFMMSIVPVIARGRTLMIEEARVSVPNSELAKGRGCRSFFLVVASFGLKGDQRPEVRILGLLCGLVLVYWVGMQLLGWLLISIIMRAGRHEGYDNPWKALFVATSATCNCGLTVIPLPLEQPYAPAFLLVVGLLAVFGNTLFPVGLRGLIRVYRWILTKFGNHSAAELVTLLLANPRSCYTMLFPAFTTRWLALISCMIMATELAALLISEMAFPGPLLDGISTSGSVYALIFQALVTRCAGFSVLYLGRLQTSSAMVLSLCMYLSTTPQIVVMRSTVDPCARLNDVQPTLSWADEEVELVDDNLATNTWILTKKLLDFWGNFSGGILLVAYLILIVEENRHDAGAAASEQSFLQVVFEVCSAYGTSGLSMSVDVVSVSASWTRASKIFLMVGMMLGRMRAMPESVDPAWCVKSQGLIVRVDSPEGSVVGSEPEDEEENARMNGLSLRSGRSCGSGTPRVVGRSSLFSAAATEGPKRTSL